MAPALDLLDFAGIVETDTQHDRAAIQRGDNFQDYIPSDGLDFIVRNYRALARLQALEPTWLDCHVLSSYFSIYGIETTKAIFDTCDRQRLRMLNPPAEIRAAVDAQLPITFADPALSSADGSQEGETPGQEGARRLALARVTA